MKGVLVQIVVVEVAVGVAVVVGVVVVVIVIVVVEKTTIDPIQRKLRENHKVVVQIMITINNKGNHPPKLIQVEVPRHQ